MVIADLTNLLRRLWLIVQAFLLALMVSGCDPFADPESMLDEYVKRVARVLDDTPKLTALPDAPGLPRLRERVRDVPALNVSMLEFLGLYGCELHHVIGERNSGLGRVMHPATRLDYELRFIRAADECAAKLEREVLVQRLYEVNALKRAVLADVVWNATWGSREIEGLFTRSRGPLPIATDQNTVSLIAHDLQSMNVMMADIVTGNVTHDVRALEPVYQRWIGHALAGQVVSSAILLSTRLDDAAALIEARVDDEKNPLCYRQMRNARADTMYSMFVSVYAGHVQPYLADVQRVRGALLSPLQSLASLGGASASEPFAQFADATLSEDAETSYWRAFDASIARHTRAWQALLDQCGLRPGQS